LAPGKSAELRVVFLQANGVASGFLSATPYRYSYQVDKSGKADISAAKTKLLLQPLVEAVNTRNTSKARAILESVEVKVDPKISEIATRFASASNKKPEPLPTGSGKIDLSDVSASEEKTGYGPPLRDRLPAPEGILASGGRVFAHGLYAHAPARHVWNLDGKCIDLTGFAGLADGNDGSVEFIIEGDGKILWKSAVVKSGAVPAFKVDLTGIKQLILRTEDAGDGNRSDWALWLEPVLSR
jgi:NPCBM/NEW2 domain